MKHVAVMAMNGLDFNFSRVSQYTTATMLYNYKTHRVSIALDSIAFYKFGTVFLKVPPYK